jgi:hypothetical protein
MIDIVVGIMLTLWKLGVIAAASYFAWDVFIDDLGHQTGRRSLILICCAATICGLLILFVFSRHSPLQLGFWLSWYFVDDVGVATTSWGSSALIRLALLRRDIRCL